MAEPTMLGITIGRDGRSQLWGFRLRGGADVGEPLVVQRVTAGSPSDGELRPGDVFLKINGHDSTGMSHDEAHDLIKSAGNTISLVVQRAGQGTLKKPSAGINATLPRKRVGTLSGLPAAHRISDIMASPIDNLPVTVFPPNEVLARQEELLHEEKIEREKERVAITHQPYRTTPLVLPGAKVKRETGLPQSFLRLQQNSNLWNSTQQAEIAEAEHSSLEAANNTLLKKKLEAAAALMQANAANTAAAEGPADTPSQYQVVHKQFNSPMGLYSKENIEQTISAQTGLMTSHEAAHARSFNPRESETYRALLDAENKAPLNKPTTREFKPAPSKANDASHPVPFKVNVMGNPQEKIQQSYSFKRIMADVLGETDF